MDEKNYSTRDLTLASTLLTLEFELVNISFQYEGTKNLPIGYFEFKNNSNLESTIQKYWSRGLAVEPMLFQSNVRALKSQIHNQYKSPVSKFNQAE